MKPLVTICILLTLPAQLLCQSPSPSPSPIPDGTCAMCVCEENSNKSIRGRHVIGGKSFDYSEKHSFISSSVPGFSTTCRKVPLDYSLHPSFSPRQGICGPAIVVDKKICDGAVPRYNPAKVCLCRMQSKKNKTDAWGPITTGEVTISGGPNYSTISLGGTNYLIDYFGDSVNRGAVRCDELSATIITENSLLFDQPQEAAAAGIPTTSMEYSNYSAQRSICSDKP
jgi:hypothetical protein